MSGDSAELTRLQLTRYALAKNGSVKLDESTQFSAQINPADVRHRSGIRYHESTPMGAAYVEPKFSAANNETLSFNITLDGTGVVPPATGQAADVKGQLAQLNKVVYEYADLKTEPPYVRVLWGTLIFFGRMTSMDTQHTLFKPGGDVLRAKVALSFVGAMSTDKDSKQTYRMSTSTLSRTVTVKAGDSLGGLCDDIYGDPSAFMKVARYNGLTDFRDIPPGKVLIFPPIGN
ncbi:MAG: LysM domain-containing protein [Rubrivivax sp.]|nr:MAG: LysM domain-containing protein [Rubrivivax sp.]